MLKSQCLQSSSVLPTRAASVSISNVNISFCSECNIVIIWVLLWDVPWRSNVEGISSYCSFSRSIIAGWQSADSDLPLHIWLTRIPGQQGPGHSDPSRQSQQAVTVVRLSRTRIVTVTVTMTVTVKDLIQACTSDSGQSWPGPAGGARDEKYDCTLAHQVTISFVHSLAGWQTHASTYW
jgi:hypothetical protein